MDIFGHIIVGLIVTALGVAGVKYNFQLANFTGNVGFAERYIGAGGTYALFKILGVAMVIGGVLYMTGLGDPLLKALLSPLAIFFTNPQQPR